MTEMYEPPFDNPRHFNGYTPRGIDVDRNGVIWTGALGQRAHGQLRSPQVQGR